MFQNFKYTLTFRVIAIVVMTAFLGMIPLQSGYAQVVFNMPAAGQMIHVTPNFEPAQMAGLRVDLKDPFHFYFVMNKGKRPMNDDVKAAEYEKLIKYFLASLTIPNSDMWVNLSPHESTRIMPDNFAQTEMGRDLLAQDYVLKQFSSSLMYPEDDIGKKFWAKVYAQAQAKYGTTDIPIDTFNKVWITADKADIYQKNDTAFVVNSHLKVMLEQDFMAMTQNKEQFGNAESESTGANAETRKIASDIIREIIVPIIEKEVNEGESFALVRQVYSSMILATWFKRTLKESLLNQVYTDKNKFSGIEVNDPQAKEKIYKQYLEAYKVGVFNYIKEDTDPVTQEVLPRKYFSGGVQLINVEGKEKIFGPDSPKEEVQSALRDGGLGNKGGQFESTEAAMVQPGKIVRSFRNTMMVATLGLALTAGKAEAGKHNPVQHDRGNNQSQVDNVRRDANNARQDAAHAWSTVRERDSQLRERDRQVRDLQGQLDSQKGNDADLQRQLGTARKELDTVRGQLNKALDDAQQATAQLSRYMQDDGKKLDQAVAAAARTATEIQAAKDQQTIDVLQGKLSKLAQEIQAMAENQRQTVEVLQKVVNELTVKNQELKDKLGKATENTAEMARLKLLAEKLAARLAIANAALEKAKAGLPSTAPVDPKDMETALKGLPHWAKIWAEVLLGLGIGIGVVAFIINKINAGAGQEEGALAKDAKDASDAVGAAVDSAVQDKETVFQLLQSEGDAPLLRVLAAFNENNEKAMTLDKQDPAQVRRALEAFQAVKNDPEKFNALTAAAQENLGKNIKECEAILAASAAKPKSFADSLSPEQREHFLAVAGAMTGVFPTWGKMFSVILSKTDVNVNDNGQRSEVINFLNDLLKLSIESGKTGNVRYINYIESMLIALKDNKDLSVDLPAYGPNSNPRVTPVAAPATPEVRKAHLKQVEEGIRNETIPDRGKLFASLGKLETDKDHVVYVEGLLWEIKQALEASRTGLKEPQLIAAIENMIVTVQSLLFTDSENDVRAVVHVYRALTDAERKIFLEKGFEGLPQEVKDRLTAQEPVDEKNKVDNEKHPLRKGDLARVKKFNTRPLIIDAMRLYMGQNSRIIPSQYGYDVVAPLLKEEVRHATLKGAPVSAISATAQPSPAKQKQIKDLTTQKDDKVREGKDFVTQLADLTQRINQLVQELAKPSPVIAEAEPQRAEAARILEATIAAEEKKLAQQTLILKTRKLEDLSSDEQKAILTATQKIEWLKSLRGTDVVKKYLAITRRTAAIAGFKARRQAEISVIVGTLATLNRQFAGAAEGSPEAAAIDADIKRANARLTQLEKKIDTLNKREERARQKSGPINQLIMDNNPELAGAFTLQKIQDFVDQEFANSADLKRKKIDIGEAIAGLSAKEKLSEDEKTTLAALKKAQDDNTRQLAESDAMIGELKSLLSLAQDPKMAKKNFGDLWAEVSGWSEEIRTWRKNIASNKEAIATQIAKRDAAGAAATVISAATVEINRLTGVNQGLQEKIDASNNDPEKGIKRQKLNRIEALITQRAVTSSILGMDQEKQKAAEAEVIVRSKKEVELKELREKAARMDEMIKRNGEAIAVLDQQMREALASEAGAVAERPAAQAPSLAGQAADQVVGAAVVAPLSPTPLTGLEGVPELVGKVNEAEEKAKTLADKLKEAEKPEAKISSDDLSKLREKSRKALEEAKRLREESALKLAELVNNRQPEKTPAAEKLPEVVPLAAPAAPIEEGKKEPAKMAMTAEGIGKALIAGQDTTGTLPYLPFTTETNPGTGVQVSPQFEGVEATVTMYLPSDNKVKPKVVAEAFLKAKLGADVVVEVQEVGWGEPFGKPGTNGKQPGRTWQVTFTVKPKAPEKQATPAAAPAAPASSAEVVARLKDLGFEAENVTEKTDEKGYWSGELSIPVGLTVDSSNEDLEAAFTKSGVVVAPTLRGLSFLISNTPGKIFVTRFTLGEPAPEVALRPDEGVKLPAAAPVPNLKKDESAPLATQQSVAAPPEPLAPKVPLVATGGDKADPNTSKKTGKPVSILLAEFGAGLAARVKLFLVRYVLSASDKELIANKQKDKKALEDRDEKIIEEKSKRQKIVDEKVATQEERKEADLAAARRRKAAEETIRERLKLEKEGLERKAAALKEQKGILEKQLRDLQDSTKEMLAILTALGEDFNDKLANKENKKQISILEGLIRNNETESESNDRQIRKNTLALEEQKRQIDLLAEAIKKGDVETSGKEDALIKQMNKELEQNTLDIQRLEQEIKDIKIKAAETTGTRAYLGATLPTVAKVVRVVRPLLQVNVKRPWNAIVRIFSRDKTTTTFHEKLKQLVPMVEGMTVPEKRKGMKEALTTAMAFRNKEAFEKWQQKIRLWRGRILQKQRKGRAIKISEEGFWVGFGVVSAIANQYPLPSKVVLQVAPTDQADVQPPVSNLEILPTAASDKKEEVALSEAEQKKVGDLDIEINGDGKNQKGLIVWIKDHEKKADDLRDKQKEKGNWTKGREGQIKALRRAIPERKARLAAAQKERQAIIDAAKAAVEKKARQKKAAEEAKKKIASVAVATDIKAGLKYVTEAILKKYLKDGVFDAKGLWEDMEAGDRDTRRSGLKSKDFKSVQKNVQTVEELIAALLMINGEEVLKALEAEAPEAVAAARALEQTAPEAVPAPSVAGEDAAAMLDKLKAAINTGLQAPAVKSGTLAAGRQQAFTEAQAASQTLDDFRVWLDSKVKVIKAQAPATDVEKGYAEVINELQKVVPVGGINLSEDNLTINIKVDGAGMPLPAQFQDPAMINIQGLSPIIREIAPANAVNMPVLSELMQMAGSAAA